MWIGIKLCVYTLLAAESNVYGSERKILFFLYSFDIQRNVWFACDRIEFHNVSCNPFHWSDIKLQFCNECPAFAHENIIAAAADNHKDNGGGECNTGDRNIDAIHLVYQSVDIEMFTISIFFAIILF